MGLVVKTHLSRTPNAMEMTAGVRDIHCPGLVRGAGWAVLEPRSHDLVPDDFTAWLFSA